MQNQRRPQGGNKSGYLGVSAHRKKWMANLFLNGKPVFSKRFNTPEEASAAYLEAKRKFHEGNLL